MLEPYCAIPGVTNCELVILDPTGNILIYFKVALMIGGILAIPMVTYQLLDVHLARLDAQGKALRLAVDTGDDCALSLSAWCFPGAS